MPDCESIDEIRSVDVDPLDDSDFGEALIHVGGTDGVDEDDVINKVDFVM